MKIEEKIYRKLLEVPPGHVTTYGDLAKAVNLKNGQRVVGQIMKNSGGKANPQLVNEILKKKLN